MTSGLLAMPVALLRQLGGRKNLEYANLHVEVIRSFGLFPPRDTVLGRTSTPAAKALLGGGGLPG